MYVFNVPVNTHSLKILLVIVAISFLSCGNKTASTKTNEQAFLMLDKLVQQADTIANDRMPALNEALIYRLINKKIPNKIWEELQQFNISSGNSLSALAQTTLNAYEIAKFSKSDTKELVNILKQQKTVAFVIAEPINYKQDSIFVMSYGGNWPDKYFCFIKKSTTVYLCSIHEVGATQWINSYDFNYLAAAAYETDKKQAKTSYLVFPYVYDQANNTKIAYSFVFKIHMPEQGEKVKPHLSLRGNYWDFSYHTSANGLQLISYNSPNNARLSANGDSLIKETPTQLRLYNGHLNKEVLLLEDTLHHSYPLNLSAPALMVPYNALQDTSLVLRYLQQPQYTALFTKAFYPQLKNILDNTSTTDTLQYNTLVAWLHKAMPAY